MTMQFVMPPVPGSNGPNRMMNSGRTQTIYAAALLRIRIR